MTKHLRQKDLAARWHVSPRTLERWRWTGIGPAFLKVEGRVAERKGQSITHEFAGPPWPIYYAGGRGPAFRQRQARFFGKPPGNQASTPR